MCSGTSDVDIQLKLYVYQKTTVDPALLGIKVGFWIPLRIRIYPFAIDGPDRPTPQALTCNFKLCEQHPGLFIDFGMSSNPPGVHHEATWFQ